MSVRTDNEIVIYAPMDLVWDMTNDVANWPDLFTEYATADILDRQGETIRFRLTTHPDENGKVWQEPVIGWACVVIWAAYASENEDPDTKGTNQFQTEVQPVTLASDGTMEPVVFRDGVTLFSLAMPGMVRL